MLTKDKSEKELLQEARKAEENGSYKDAIDLYKLLIRKNDLESLYYDRLMIIYRKEKKYREELAVIEKGIKTFEGHFSARAKKLYTTHTAAVSKLSQALMKKTGLREKNHEYLPEPLNKWRKRKQIVLKKIR